MNGRRLPLVKYLIGFSLALLAVSNCFNVQSNSSNPTSSDTAAASHMQAAKPDPRNSSLVSLAAANHGGAVASSRGGADMARAALATHASIFSSAASPFAPAITATKSHMPAGNANPGDTLTYTVIIT